MTYRLAPPPNLPSNSPELSDLRRFAQEVLESNGKALRDSAAYIKRGADTVYIMSIVLFVVGIVTAVATIIRGFAAPTSGDAVQTLAFAGLTAASFFALFIIRPYETMERSGIFNTWLLAATNTYWTRLMYMNDPATVNAELKAATADLIEELATLADTYSAAAGKYPAPIDVRSGGNRGQV